MAIIICGEECESCIHNETTPEDMKEWKIRCSNRDKIYRWGQCIDCHSQVKIKIDDERA